MRRIGRAAAGWATGIGLGLAGCLGGAPGPDTCQIEFVRLDAERTVPGGYDIGYLVRGYAGTRGVVSLVARRPDGSMLPGKGVEVGPGAFQAVIEQRLTAPAPSYVALLELASTRRCRDDIRR